MSFASLDSAVIKLNDRLQEFAQVKTDSGFFCNLGKCLKKIAVKSAADKVVQMLNSFKFTYNTEKSWFESLKTQMVRVEQQFYDIESKEGWDQSESIQEAVNQAIEKFLLVFSNPLTDSSFRISKV